MAIQTQLLNIQFRAGLDEKTQDQVLEPGQGFVTIENRVQSKTGGFEKRPGYRKTSDLRQDGTTRTVGQSVFALGEQRCVYDGSRLDVFSEQAGWVNGGTLRNLTIENIPTHTVSSTTDVDSGIYVDGYEMARAGSYTVMSHTIANGTDNSLIISVFDTETGTNVLEHTIGPTTVPVRCKFGVISGRVIAFYTSNVSPTNIFAIELNTGTLGLPGAAWTAPFTVATTWDGVDLDVTSQDDLGTLNAAVALGYSDSGTLRMVRLTAYNTVTATTSHIIGGFISSLALGGDASNHVYAAVTSAASTSDVEVYSFDPATLTQDAASGVAASMPGLYSPFRLGITAVGTNQAHVVAHQVKAGTLPAIPVTMFWSRFNAGGGGPVPFLSGQSFGVMAITRPVAYAGKTIVHAGYLGFLDNGNEQRMEYLIDISTTKAQPLATVNARLSSWSNPLTIINVIRRSSTHMAVAGDTVYFVSYRLLNASAKSVGIVKLTSDRPVSPAVVSSNDGAHMPGALPAVFDGREVIEESFLCAPAIHPVVSGAGPIPAGSYSYIAIYERVDSYGNILWSAPSFPKGLGPAAGGTIQVRVQGYGISMANDSAYQTTNVALYRTKDTGTVYYRLGTKPATPDLVTFTDTVLDSAIEDNAVLYTQPGQLGTSQPRQCPPAFSCETVHMDRVFGANGKNVWYSAVTVDGEGTWFSDAFQFPVERGGNITGLCSQDGRLYIFKPDSIYYVDGQGPPENGGNGTEFSSPIEIPTTGGCIDPRSIVRTQAGIMFQSSRGIEMLTRKQEVMWIGEGIDDHLTQYPVVTSAVLDEPSSRVTFTLATDETATDCSMVVYDFTVSTWCSLTVDTDVASGQAAAAIVPTSAGDRFAFLTPDGTLLIERDGSSLDQTGAPPDAFVVSTVETPWLKMAQLGGYQRTRRIMVQGERQDPHDMTISVAYDYSPTYTHSRTFTWAEISTFPHETLEIHLRHQKSQAIRIKIEDGPPTGNADVPVTGKGCTLFGLTIEWGMKQGLDKISARQRR